LKWLEFFPLTVQKENNGQFCDISGYQKKVGQQIFPLFVAVVGSGKRDKYQDLLYWINIPDPQHCSHVSK
jgi:hypothetical protein